MTRIVFISDTHLQHHFNIPEGDILVHAGDFTSRGTIHNNEWDKAMKWFGGLPHTFKVCCAGNHDFLPETHPKLAEESIPDGVHYLKDSEVTLMGLRFYGSPYQPEFFQWAWNLPRGGDALKEVWAKIPDGIDVLITHGPPIGVLDLTPPRDGRLGQHVGCYDLMERIKVVKPKIHCFGHIHHSFGHLEKDGVLYINASVCNERYRPVNPPFVMDL